MIRDLEKPVQEYHDQVLKEPISQDMLFEFYRRLKRLVQVLVRTHYSRLTETDRDELVDQTLTCILLRVRDSTLAKDLAWIPYLKQVLHGLYVTSMRDRSRQMCAGAVDLTSRTIQSLTTMNPETLEDESDVVVLETAPDVIEEVCGREDAVLYLKDLVTLIRLLSRKNVRLALLGFYSYRYGVPVELLPLTETESMVVSLVAGACDYYLRVSKPRDMCLLV